MELREKIARAVSRWPLHQDGFDRDGVFSEHLYAKWQAIALAQANEILALIVHDSDCATHNEPAYPNSPCDCSVSQ